MQNLIPAIIRLKNAPFYCGMNRKRFNREVRPLLTIVPIGKKGIGFYRQELDAWAERIKNTQGFHRTGEKHGKKAIFIRAPLAQRDLAH